MTRKSFVIWTIILAFLSSFFFIKLMRKKINPVLLRYSTVELKIFSTNLINSAVNKKIIDSIDKALFSVEKDKNGKIQTLDYNTKKANILLEEIAKSVQKKVLDLENGNIKDLNISENFKGKHFPKTKSGVVCEIPMSTIFSNSLLSNIGPVIPIKLSFIGSVVTNLNTKIKSYGINTIYLETTIHVELSEIITMPMMTKEQIVSVDIPLIIKVIEGTIPNYYYKNGLNENSNSYVLPIN